MRPGTFLFVAFVLLFPALPTGPARADTFELLSSDWPMRLPLDAGGEVHGVYPKRQGEMFGHDGADGNIHGIWTQPRSDHPCHELRRDTYTWGGFVISNPYRRNVSGSWGYCGEEPLRDWQIERR